MINTMLRNSLKIISFFTGSSSQQGQNQPNRVKSHQPCGDAHPRYCQKKGITLTLTILPYLSRPNLKRFQSPSKPAEMLRASVGSSLRPNDTIVPSKKQREQP
ncbi:MAG: hypothetical protein CL958_06750 [Euryarchaeota archaeon]|nr:hypothetical protein [Marinobacter sp.]